MLQVQQEKAPQQKIAEPTRRNSIANSAKLKEMHSKLAGRKKAKNNGNQKSGNPHKARQIMDAASPNLTDDESDDHKVGRTIVTCSDDYKVYRMTRREEEDQEQTDEKIVVPRGAQGEILKEMHRSHSGILNTYTTAAQLFYWPGMKN